MVEDRLIEAQRVPVMTRNQGIDLLRGLSILLVILNHVGLRIPLTKTAMADFIPHRVLRSLNFNGYEAVFIFFVISGFLIADNALRRWHSLPNITLKVFYARRFSRIVPCLLVLVLVLSILHLAGFQDYVIKHVNQSLPRAILAALGLHLNWYEGQTGYLPGNWDVLWSLSIEEVFYVGFPLVCLLSRRTRVLIPILVILALSLPFSHAAAAGNPVWREKAYLPGMAAIAMGILGALLVEYAKPPRWGYVIALCSAGSLGLLAVLLFGDILWSSLHDSYLLLLTFSTICLTTGFYWREQVGRYHVLPGFGWLRAYGRLSYEVYLTHMFVVYAAVRLFRYMGGDLRPGYIWYVPVILLCGLLGVVVARGFSIPCDHALRRRLLATSL